ncbi:MAG TPA: hypothetical protein VEJ86_02065, partial [Candidatus Binataceae bacterium]|nr:hypothetical protein [Candidatus Binataceae bacterium]
RTTEGKRNSRMNALKHGILARDPVIARLEGDAARRDYEALLEGLAAEYQPETATEELLVLEIADATVRLRRVRLYETREAWRHRKDEREYVDIAAEEFDEQLDRFRRQERRLSEVGASSLTLPPPEVANLVLRYESLLTRNLFRAIGQLRALKRERQAERLSRQAQRLSDDERSHRAHTATAPRDQGDRSGREPGSGGRSDPHPRETATRVSTRERPSGPGSETKPNLAADPQTLAMHQVAGLTEMMRNLDDLQRLVGLKRAHPTARARR